MKSLSASAGDIIDVVSMPGLGRSSGEWHGNHCIILAWRIPWTEELGRVQSMGLQGVKHDLSD